MEKTEDNRNLTYQEEDIHKAIRHMVNKAIALERDAKDAEDEAEGRADEYYGLLNECHSALPAGALKDRLGKMFNPD
jgi:hypothetical protein